MLNVFWVLPHLFGIIKKIASHWGNVKCQRIERAYPQKVLKIRARFKMLKIVKVFWVSAPLFCGGRGGGGQDPENL